MEFFKKSDQKGNSSKIIIVVIVVLVIIGLLYFTSDKGDGSTQSPPEMQKTETAVNTQFTNPKKSAHYETNTPAHGTTLAGSPVNVVIDFNFDLAPTSVISITNEEKEYGTGKTVIDTNKLAMRRSMSSDAPDGTFTVTYKACWPDNSCHDGNFQFAIDRSLASQYEDLQNSKNVTIRLSQINFKPKLVKITKGTTVTWINDEDVDHYVNTDSHPAHTFVKDMNSKLLQKGSSYSYTFTAPGDYPYHCSAHADAMTGSILVE